MKKNLIILLILSFSLSGFYYPAYCAENQKLAQTGMKFLSVSLDARASALSGALTAIEGNSTSLFYNPAGMARLENFATASFGQVQFIANINYIYGSAAFSPENGIYGVFGFSFLSVDYGDFEQTIRAENEQGFLDLGIYRPSAFALGFGYAKALTDKFSVGGQIKYVNQNLIGGINNFAVDQSIISRDFEKDILAYDLGILYKTGYKSLNFGMNIRNFSKEIKYIKETFELPLTFEIGLSMDLLDVTDIDPEKHSVVFSVDAVHPRDFKEQVDLGMEYIFMKMLALRLGYTSPTDEQGISLGAGFNQEIESFDLSVDYAYTDFGVFDEVHRFSFNFSF